MKEGKVIWQVEMLTVCCHETPGWINLNIKIVVWGSVDRLCSSYPLLLSIVTVTVDRLKILLWRQYFPEILSPNVTFFVENVIATRKYDCSQFEGVNGLPLSVTPQSLTPRSSDSPGSVAPCE